MFGMYREISKIELKVGLEDFGLRKLTYLLEKGLYLGSITNSEEGHEVIIDIFNSIPLHHSPLNKFPYKS